MIVNTNMKSIIMACVIGVVAGAANTWAAEGCCAAKAADKVPVSSCPAEPTCPIQPSCCPAKTEAVKTSCSMAATAAKPDCAAKIAKSGKRNLRLNQKGATLLAQL